MKWLFYLLLIANAVIFAYARLDAGNSNAQSAHPPFNADKIKLLREMPAAPILKPVAKLETAITAEAVKPVCLEWGSFAGEEQMRAQRALEPLQLGEKLGSRSVEEGATYWVYIPPLKTRKDAEKKIAELKSRGVTEFFLVPDGASKNAISLGIFKSEELAKNYLAKLQTKGVLTAIISERGHAAKRTLFQVRDVGDQVVMKFGELQRDFPGSEVRTIECPSLGAAAAAR